MLDHPVPLAEHRSMAHQGHTIPCSCELWNIIKIMKVAKARKNKARKNA